VSACAEEPVATGSKSGKSRRARVKDAGAADAAAETPLPQPDIQENEWVESERSRDPFRSHENLFVEEARNRVKSQREVVLDQFSLDELKLVGIVLRANPAMAMLVDPTGKGHTVRRGQFVGRAEVVQKGQRGVAYELNWRVDLIRDGDVIFVREDPQNPDVPSATKVLPLHPEGNVASGG
jgi:type IV pilus assembly protein PilP